MKKKTVFIIPGHRHKPWQKAYKNIAGVLKKQGFFTISIPIPWGKTTISQNTDYFIKEYKKVKRKDKYILGFSFGAIIAFIAATKVTTKGLILCSLSPYFKEDLRKSKKNKLESLSQIQYKDFLEFKSKVLAKRIKAKKIFMLYGDMENKLLVDRVNKTFSQIELREKYLLPIQKTEHNILDKRYLQTISITARVLN